MKNPDPQKSSVLPRRSFVVAAAASGVGCCPCLFSNRERWQNVVNSARTTPLDYRFPSDAEDLVQAVNEAEAAQLRVRMTGSGHSFSDVAVTQDLLLSPECLDECLELDSARLKQPNDHLVRVQAGIPLRKLNDALDERGLALENMGGYDAQTIVGAAITGTHGSGLGYGPIASQIRSMQVVATDGKVIQLEPSAGITNPEGFVGFLEEDSDVSVELIQDDQLFYAAAVSLGTMGVVYSVVLQTVDKFWLDEKRTIVKWQTLKKEGGFLDRLLKGQPLADQGPEPDFYEIWVNPYSLRCNKNPTCLLTQRFKLQQEPTRTKAEQLRGKAGNSFLTSAAVLFQPSVVKITRKNPTAMPALLEQGLRGLEDSSYKNISYKVFNIGVANDAKAYGIEMGFDIAQTVAATEHVFDIAQELRERDIMHNIPISLRFVAPSKSQIAMQYGRRTMMMEIGMLVGAKGAAELLGTYERRLFKKFAARPHWGLELNVMRGSAWAEQVYPKWNEWLALYRQMNRRGTFDGAFTDRLGISVKPRPSAAAQPSMARSARLRTSD